MRFPIKSLVVLFVLFNVMMVAVGADFERESIRAVKKVSTYAMAFPDEADAQDKRFEIIRNSFHFFMVCGGALLGGAIALIFVTVLSLNVADKIPLDTHVKRGLYFSLGVFFSIVFTPLVIRTGWVVNSVNPEICFAFGGAMAIASWWMMKVINFCLERMTLAAKDKGFKGVKDELTGSTIASPGVNPPPSQPNK